MVQCLIWFKIQLKLVKRPTQKQGFVEVSKDLWLAKVLDSNLKFNAQISWVGTIWFLPQNHIWTHPSTYSNIIDCEPTATKGVWLQALLEFGNHKGGQNLPFPFQDLAHQLSSSMNNVLCLDITCLTIQTT